MFKPMLSATYDETKPLMFPLLVSPKLDGVRAVVVDGIVLSRSLKPIPNKHVQELFGKEELHFLDGELIVGDPTSPTVFRDTTSIVMSHDKVADVKFFVFDEFSNPTDTFIERLSKVKEKVCYTAGIISVTHVIVENAEDLEYIEADYLETGYEGVMLRSPTGIYKFGRSTLKEGYLVKLKRFLDSEAEILELIEQKHNANEATKNALGRTERSTAKAGMVGKDTLGAARVRDVVTGVDFEIGSGFDDAIRSEIWSDKDNYIGKLIRYKYFPVGSKDKPRFPVFQGFRDLMDM